MAQTYSIDSDTLESLALKGISSPVLQARLRFSEHDAILKYVKGMVGVERVYPRMLPTQASGRWSTTNPPLVNFTADRKWGPHGIRDVVVPDPGRVWHAFDWDAVEARITAAWCGDKEDIEAFNRNWDIHTLTACGMYGWPKPEFEPTKALIFKSEPGKEYCLQIGRLIHVGERTCSLVNHAGCHYSAYDADGRPRRLAKNCRYSLCYGPDEGAMAKYAVEMNLSVEALLEAGRVYLRSKPLLVAWKRKWWSECGRTRLARTALGRRRVLSGYYNVRAKVQEYAKQGLNHMVQGTVTDAMNLCIIQVTAQWPECGLKLNKHDGAVFDFPVNVDPHPAVKEYVERTWVIGGNPIKFTAEWDRTLAPEEEAA